MTTNIGEVEALYITPLDGAPAATVDGQVPTVLEIGTHGLARYGVDSRGYQVMRYHGPKDGFEPISPSLLAQVGVDIRYEQMTFTHPSCDSVSMPIVPSLQPSVQPEVTAFFAGIVGDEVRLVGPLHHHGRYHIAGEMPSHESITRQNTLRLAVTDAPGSILVDNSLPQPIIPGVDVVVTGDRDVFLPGQTVTIHRPGAETHSDVTGWVSAIQNLGLADCDYRVADIEYHRDAAGLRVAVGSQVLLKQP
ncbi:MAG: hypothetical protein KIH63_000540 [Candidatus Saccharibacteria bacterium]|nr:hypothetical protein [Candidatus Saccharibacteria bacterium]